MAKKQKYVSKSKLDKAANPSQDSKTNKYDVLTHPTKRWWGKAISIIIIFGFMGLLIFSLIYLIIQTHLFG